MIKRRVRQNEHREAPGSKRERQVPGYEHPSTLSDDRQALLSNRLDAFKHDAFWRRKALGGIGKDGKSGFDKAAKLVDTKSTDTDEEGVPAMNHIRGACDDLKSVALMNFPGTKLEPSEIIDPRAPDHEVEIRRELAWESAERANQLVETQKMQNQWTDDLNHIIDHAVAFGVGYRYISSLETASMQRTPRLRRLMAKDPQQRTARDWELIRLYAKGIVGKHVDTRKVYWQYGVKRVADQAMRRVDLHDHYDTAYLRHTYKNNRIMPGVGHLGLKAADYKRRHHSTGVVTTWEIERYKEKETTTFFMDGEGEPLRTVYEDQLLVKTVFTGTEILEHEVYDPGEAYVELPIYPYYVKQAQDHPYGFGLPLQLELAQQFINRIRALLYKQALNSVSPQAVAVLVENLAKTNDREQLEKAFEEGGIMWFEGNQNAASIQDVVQPLQYAASGANQALAEVMMHEKAAIDAQSNAINQEGFNRIRSAAGKHAHMQAVDRPKHYMVGLLSEAAENETEALYRWIQVLFPDEEIAPIRGSKGIEGIVVNEKVRKAIVETDYQGRPMRLPSLQDPVYNPEGLVYKVRTMRRNSTQIDMYAVADGRGSLPQEPLALLQAVGAMADAELFLSEKTKRDLALPDDIKQLDDANAAKEAREREEMVKEQQVMQMLQAAQQQAGGGGRQFSLGGGGGGQPSPQRQAGQALVDGIPGERAGGVTPQERERAMRQSVEYAG